VGRRRALQRPHRGGQANRNIVVADGYWNSRLVWFSPEGEFIKQVGGWGRGPAQFNTPHALTQDSQGRLLVADLCGGNFHDYMTVRGQIAEHRTKPTPGCKHRIQRLDPDGKYIDEWTHIAPLSLATYGKRIYASDKMSNLAILDEDSGAVLERVENLAIYIHSSRWTRTRLTPRRCIPSTRAGGPRGRRTTAGRG
jgi:hypothetical protein